MVLGLIPHCDLSHVKAVGNAAGTGARMALLNRTHRREIEATVAKVEKIETALKPHFQQFSSTPWRCRTRSTRFRTLRRQ